MSRLASSTPSSSTAASTPQWPRMYSEARESSSDTEPGKGGSRLASPEACACACECTSTGVGVVGAWTCGCGSACAACGSAGRFASETDVRTRSIAAPPPSCSTVSPRPCMYRSGRSSEKESACVSTLSSSVAPDGLMRTRAPAWNPEAILTWIDVAPTSAGCVVMRVRAAMLASRLRGGSAVAEMFAI
eukprot:scaffold11629_cov63-Phaeocystis_antarctica.AAC.9